MGKDTVLSGIINMVKQAQGEKPPVQLLADRISAIFIPTVLGIAAITLIANWIILKDNNGKEIFSTTIQLNEKMDPVLVTEIVMTDSLPDITTTRCTYNLYDRTGNWIERNETDEKGTTLKTLKRKITYKNK